MSESAMVPDADSYTFATSDCDVVDKERLEQFRQKRREWRFLFEGDAVHNIRRQINGLMWSDAAFRVLNRMRAFGSESQPTASNNRTIAEFIDIGYITTQVLRISRLTDQWHDKPEKNVVSLPRLLYEVRQNAYLITRENFVSFDGLPYDYEAVETPSYTGRTIEQLRQFQRPPTSGRDASHRSRLMHQAFDKLARTQQRSRMDNVD
ncbi:MAG: hypothetical protein ACKOEE_05010, partial [Tagaea sp.]